MLHRPLFGRTGRLVVGPDAGAVEEGHAEPDVVPLGQRQKAFPHAQVRPADEGLRRFPPRPEFGQNAAPLGTVLAALDNRLDGLAQIVVLGLAVRTAGLDQRLQHRPLRIRQHHVPPHQHTPIK